MVGIYNEGHYEEKSPVANATKEKISEAFTNNLWYTSPLKHFIRFKIMMR